ncbi:uncharacterized protein DDB_G0283357-like, partial [Musca vetustissima]|uniref:uncharacterized protein DDB_G0283357-like n=1 Tax=Musca vetustissima TaxID=27455 RepID=UPI002AB64A75
MPVTNGPSTNNQSQSEFCDFLKRKYPDDENDISPTENQNIENQNSDSNNSWKKQKHNEEEEQEEGRNPQSYEMTPDTTSPSTPYNSCEISTSSPGKYATTINGNNQTSPTTSNTSSAEVTHVTSTSSNTFNIMTNNPAFINDLFAYDANLLVPTTSGDNILSNGEPSFTTPSAICVNTNSQQFEAENGDNWQATDLLELDHRYNSTLQTEIAQLNPTVSLKPHEENLVTMVEQQQRHNTTHSNPNPHHQHMQSTPRQYISNSHDVTSKSSPVCGKSLPSLHNQQMPIDNDPDFEDRNLSWLLNFKFDEFPHLNPDITGAQNKSQRSALNCNGGSGGYKVVNGNSSNTATNGRERSKSPKNSNKAGKKFEELVMEVTSEMEGSDMAVAENVVIEDTTVPQRA